MQLMNKPRTDLDSRFDDTERKYEEKAAAGTYYWVWEPTRRLLFGPENTEEEAYNRGLAKIPGGDFKIIPLNTRNKAEASSRIKGLQFADNKVTLNEATKRVKHKWPR